jgi:hypothetical protein
MTSNAASPKPMRDSPHGGHCGGFLSDIANSVNRITLATSGCLETNV